MARAGVKVSACEYGVVGKPEAKTALAKFGLTKYTVGCQYGFLEAIIKIRKTSSCLSVRPHGTSQLPLDGFS